VSPVERAVSAVTDPISDWFDGVTDGTSLKKENRDLRAEVERLQNQQRDAKTALEQNETLQRLLDLPVLADVPRVTAKVVNRSPSNFEWTVTIDKGEESGISPDMPVMGPAGLVGRVLESWKGGSKILLLIDPESNVGVRVQPGLVTGIAEGVAGNDRLRLDLDANAAVNIGDSVVTSGLENSSFPEGLSVGKVVETEQQPGGLGTIVRVDPWTDFDALTFVTVLRWVPGQGPVTTTTTTTTAPTTTTTPPATDTTSSGNGN
jgi:rod shape-determining protein MreC